ncbi:MAG: HlyC/CorC family transporter [Victivallales bacterium]|nr:HlyC/CorC family transporter [Victivallales bacterium]
MSITIAIVVLLLLYFLAALFCCIETAFTSVNKTWLRDQAEQGSGSAKLAMSLLEQSGSFFGTVLFGTNLVHVSITTLVGSVLVAAFLQTELAGSLGLSKGMQSLLTSAFVTPTLLLFTELVPKAIGRSHAERLTIALAGVLRLFKTLFAPAVYALDAISSRLARMLGAKENTGLGQVSRDDLKVLAEVAEEHGVIHKEARKIMSSALEFDNKPIETVMVPLVDVKSVPATANVGEVIKLAEESGFTRFPVYESRVDEIVGLISLRRCIYEFNRFNDEEAYRQIARQPITKLIDRNVSFVPESMTVGAVLNDLRNSHSPMMVVVDEYGGVVGVVTSEDLIGLLVGGIADLRNQAVTTIRKVSDGVFECDGKTDIRELEAVLGLKIENQGYETAAGLALKLSGSIPRKGAVFNYRGYAIRILEVQKHRIVSLRFSKEGR